MPIISLQSTVGGAGRTSLTAGLATVLAARGLAVLAIDADPQNLLAAHLGMRIDQTAGYGGRLLAGSDWDGAAFRNSDNVHFVPFGSLSDGSIDMLGQRLSADPRRLRRFFGPSLGDADLVIIDAPRWPSPFAAAALAAADFALVLVRPDGAAFATVTRMETALQNASADQPSLAHGYVLNHMESSHPLHNDLLVLYRATLGSRLAPYYVHRDDVIPKALATESSIIGFAPTSQAGHDLQGVARWLLGLLGMAPPAPKEA